MTTAIIIPAWCWDEHTLQMAIDGVDNIRSTAGSRFEYEVIMVYAGIDPGIILPPKLDHFQRMDPPQGWAVASNIGMLLSGCDHYVIGSTDIRVPDGWLPKMLECAKDDAIVSPLDFKKGKRREWDATMRGSFWGGWFLFHGSIINRIGYLDPTMHRLADMDWALRARKAGIPTVRVAVEAEHILPHHTQQAHPNPFDSIVRKMFVERHGVERFGEWEGLPK